MKHYILAILILIVFITSHYAQVSQSQVISYNGSGNSADAFRQITVDAAGNIYTSGTTYSTATDVDIIVAKYNSAGTLLWQQRHNGTSNSGDQPACLLVDASGNVYVCGYTVNTGTGSDCFTAKYSPSGALQWSAVYNNASTNNNDKANSLTVDNLGNVYVTGQDYAFTTGADAVTLKYNSAGALEWARRCATNSEDMGYSVAFNSTDGAVYVTGFYGFGFVSKGILTIKYNSGGDSVWVKRFSGTSNLIDAGKKVLVDNAGNIIVGGFTFNNGTNYDGQLLKYSSAGTLLWARALNSNDAISDQFTDIALDQQGGVYACGVSGVTPNTDYFAVEVSSQGNMQWWRTYNGTGNGNDEANSISTDNDGNCYVSGYTTIGANYTYISTIKFNTSGDQEWLVNFTGLNGAGYNIGYGAKTDNNGNVFVAGYAYNNANIDGVIVKYSQTLSGISPVNSEIPEKFSLSQNYPNPFNPMTNVKFQMPNDAFVRLIVYDIQGKEAAVLVNEKLEAGTYSVNFNAAGLSSGIYFYKLITAGYTETRKMILVK